MREKPDVVGTAEAADILGVEVPRITRWRIGGKMPKWAAWTAATPVWHRADIEAMRDRAGRDNTADLPFSGVLDLVGTAECSEIIDVNKSQIGRWRRAGQFPEPCLDRRSDAEPAGLKGGPLWWREDVRAFKRARDAAKRRRAKREEEKAATAAAK